MLLDADPTRCSVAIGPCVVKLRQYGCPFAGQMGAQQRREPGPVTLGQCLDHGAMLSERGIPFFTIEILK
jgi:hypothetical protein